VTDSVKFGRIQKQADQFLICSCHVVNSAKKPYLFFSEKKLTVKCININSNSGRYKIYTFLCFGRIFSHLATLKLIISISSKSPHPYTSLTTWSCGSRLLFWFPLIKLLLASTPMLSLAPTLLLDHRPIQSKKNPTLSLASLDTSRESFYPPILESCNV
jgi:hypothetical protein